MNKSDDSGCPHLFLQTLVRNRVHCSGISYIEILLSSVIICVLLVSAMVLFGNLGRSRQDTVDQDSAGYLILEMIEEIKQQNYQDPDVSGNFGMEVSETGSGRSLFDDVDDYHSWSACPPQDRQGNPLSSYLQLTRSVSIRYVAANDFTQTAAGDEGFKEVTITIDRDSMVLLQRKYVISNVIVGLP